MGICQHRQQVCENRTYGLHSLQLLQGDSFCWSGNHIQVSINTSIPGWKSVGVHKHARNSCKIWKFSVTLKAIGQGKSSPSTCTSQHFLDRQIFRTLPPAQLMSSPRSGFAPVTVQVGALGRRCGAGKNLLTCGNDTTKDGYTSMSEVRLETVGIQMLARTYTIRVWER